MTQYQHIPLPGDNRNDSQVDLLANFDYLIDLSNPGTPLGVLPVDHKITGNNGISQVDGFHNQVSFLNQTAPTTLVNAINGQSSNGIAYTKNDTDNNAQLHFYNGASNGIGSPGGQMDYPISIIKAFISFDGTSLGFNGPGFNVASVTRPTATGDFLITFSNKLPNNNYVCLMSAGRPSGQIPIICSHAAGAYATIHTTTTFRMICNDNGNVLVNPSVVNVVIIGL